MFAGSVDDAEHSSTLDSAMDGGLSIGPPPRTATAERVGPREPTRDELDLKSIFRDLLRQDLCASRAPAR